MSVPKEEARVVFAVGQDATGAKVLVLGFPEAAWEHMRDGDTHTFDLTKVGVPLKLLIFGGKDREEVLAAIPVGPHTCDARDRDMGWQGPGGQD